MSTRGQRRADALDCAHDLASALAAARALAVAADVDRARGRTRYARDLAAALGRTDVCVVALNRSLGRDLGRAADLDQALDRALARADDVAHARHLDRAHDLGLAEDLAADLIRDLIRASERTLTGTARGQCGHGRVAPLAGRLLAAAARLLPAADRARYAEEYRSELWELAHADGRRRTQLAYAARQVLYALRLCRELRTPRRRGAAS
jgi:hypothetical protein